MKIVFGPINDIPQHQAYVLYAFNNHKWFSFITLLSLKISKSRLLRSIKNEPKNSIN